MTILILLGFMLGSCITVVCILSYCKTRILKNTGTMNNMNYSRNRSYADSRSRPTTTVFVVPTTSQVIEMYATQASVAANNNTYELPPACAVRKPPSYGAVIIADIPPSYEQAIQHLDNETK